jgi:hypothetical protein
MELDDRITARLIFDGTPEPLGMVYLRALALGDMRFDKGCIRWELSSTGQLVPQVPEVNANAWAWIYRATGCGDVVLRPDYGHGASTEGLLRDRDGNLFCPGLGEAPRIYRADLGLEDSQQPRMVAQDLDRFRLVPREVAAWPWAGIVEGHWANLPAEQAAEAIAKRLRERCRYDLDHLPIPSPEPGSALRVFLFGSDPDRRGHCQYFATAAALMLRRAGHAARCVAGFASNEYDERGVVFRSLHAHAWLEVVDQGGIWRRVDPTPPAERAKVVAELAKDPSGSHRPGTRKTEELPQPVPLSKKESDQGGYSNWMTALLAAGVGSAWWIWYRHRRAKAMDPRRLALKRQTDELMRLAVELGIPVRSSSTLTWVCGELTALTGIDLSGHLAEHLTARYGDGGFPAPWPAEELRQAAANQAKNNGSST